MKVLTFDEWKALGYRVRKGEKASSRNDKGKATFTRDQIDEDDYFDRENGLHFERD